jgi:hypothetical protein
MSTRDRELTVRFAIGDKQGARSSVWRIWKGRRKDDIYVAPRSVAGIMKGSLHASGHCHFAVTTQHHEKISAGTRTMLPERTITTWERRRPSPTHDVVQAVSILFAAEFLSDKSYPIGPGTRLIDAPVPGNAIIVDFLFAMQAVGQLLLRPNQTELGRVVPANGELFLVIAGLVEDFDSDRFRRQTQPLNEKTWSPFVMEPPAGVDPDKLRGCIFLPGTREGVLRIVEIGLSSFNYAPC